MRFPQIGAAGEYKLGFLHPIPVQAPSFPTKSVVNLALVPPSVFSAISVVEIVSNHGTHRNHGNRFELVNHVLESNSVFSAISVVEPKTLKPIPGHATTILTGRGGEPRTGWVGDAPCGRQDHRGSGRQYPDPGEFAEEKNIRLRLGFCARRRAKPGQNSVARTFP